MNTAQKFAQAAELLMESSEGAEAMKNLFSLITAYSPPGVVVLILDGYPAQVAEECQGERVASMPAGVFMGYEDFSASIVCFTTKGVHISTPLLDTQEELMQLMNSLSPVSNAVSQALKHITSRDRVEQTHPKTLQGFSP